MAQDWEGEGLSAKELLQAGMRSIMDAKPPEGPLMLFVSKAHFDKGEAWVRRAYGVGTDIEIVESVPLGRKTARRYPSALTNRQP